MDNDLGQMTADTVENELETPPPYTEAKTGNSKTLIIFGVVGLVVIIGVVLAAILLFNQDAEDTGKLRDIFIILMALEAMLIGVALVVLSVQLAILINLLQNEIKPILNSTSETVNTLRGTVTFLSNNLSEPVIKLNEYLAGLRQVFHFIKPFRK